MIIKMALYGLKSSGSAFRSKLAGVLRDIGYLSTKGDPNVWIQPAVKPDGTEYNEMVLCYVDNVLAISETPMKNIEGIKAVFKLKVDKAEVPDMYLGTSALSSFNLNTDLIPSIVFIDVADISNMLST